MSAADTIDQTYQIQIPHENIVLEGEVHLPKDPAAGVVVFAHGSGSSRFSPRNQYVAKVLHTHGVGTLLMDLLTSKEEAIDDVTRELRFDIRMLTNRVVSAIDFLERDPRTAGRPFGTFGASTGGAAALWAASLRPNNIHCAISRGGRVDLVPMDITRTLSCPTTLIVGERDPQVLEWNQKVHNNLGAAKAREVVIIKGATHLFEEKGALEEVAKVAASYFEKYLKKV
ncbi:hypothetical protein HK097_009775 [Rhizophlyctis rosea]|uniref:Dienelactone hydrolase domain-containing protein n=1 Tax=Rhizophlyctis rosea TaxID=64517 RepID=A0AAD5SIZ8_9FUNG|nr:hypothetical protein HK097_009775 [Rhizophlyctis rosea]